jgi:hypothetical protein
MTETQPVVLDAVPRYGPSTRIRHPLPALVAAAGLVVAYLVLQFMWLAVAGLYNWALSRFSESLAEVLASSMTALRQDAVPAVVILIVSFLFFWAVAPIHPALRLGQVLGRGIGAAIAAGVIADIALVIQYAAVLSTPPLANYGSPTLHDLLLGAGEASVQGANSFAQTAVYIVLGAVILWNWMRVHPRSVAFGDAPVDSPTDGPMTV